ncbi:dihydrolipoamide acetyltransferase family protein [Streptomyces sp. 6N223]|uniref:dihydrolipoamide acetyltransferase family protein n=1 Tax=Streptomyces sp. 6N223 TaxID=3457412 RepID=UPI003FD11E30
MVTTTARHVREFRLPDVGEGLVDAEIIRWYVKPGDAVTDGQTICEVETAKAAVELPVPYDGVVHAVHAPEGATVRVGTVIISVDTGSGTDSEPDVPAAPAQPESARPTEEAQPRVRQPVLVGYGIAESGTRRRPHRTAPAQPNSQGLAAVPSRAAAKPPVRKLAKDLGVNLATISPSGPDGIITREDVRAAAASQVPLVPASAVSFDGARETRVPIKGVRKATAAAMVGSAFTAPHVTEFVTVDVTRTMKLVEELKQDREYHGLRVNPLLLIAKALLVAIKRNPDINASWDEAAQEIVQKHYVNLGIAAATTRGLIVPNIKDAHDKTLPQLASALGELVEAAREGRTSPAAMQGGTVTITNVGVFGIDTGTPILNSNESAILAVGAIRFHPWVHKGKVKPRQVTTLALSFDHRLVDGELGSKVLADVAAILEHPRRLLHWG